MLVMPNYIRTTILFIIILSTQIACGQKDSVIDNRFCVKVSPLSLLNHYDGPCYKVGAEIKLHNNISTYFEYGGYVKIKESIFYAKNNLTGFILKSEIKYYLNRKNLTTGQYISLEYSYKNQNFGFWGNIKVDSLTTYYKDYNISKDVSCFNLKFGEVSNKNKWFIFEYFAGMGILFMKGSNNLTEFERENIMHGEKQGGNPAGLIRLTQPWATLSITAGIKLGFRIK